VQKTETKRTGQAKKGVGGESAAGEKGGKQVDERIPHGLWWGTVVRGPSSERGKTGFRDFARCGRKEEKKCENLKVLPSHSYC